jgi:hypothetical protein
MQPVLSEQKLHHMQEKWQTGPCNLVCGWYVKQLLYHMITESMINSFFFFIHRQTL